MAEEESLLATLFLQAFVKELIKHVEPKELPIVGEELEEIEEPRFREIKGMVPSQFKIKPVTFEKHLHIVPKVSSARVARQIMPTRAPRPMTQEMGRMKPSLKSGAPLEIWPRPQTGQPITRASPGLPEIGKLNALLLDPSVDGIECPGPSKNVLVRKAGMVQKTRITLNQEEIKKIIDDFSQKTRIPLIGGTFKAAYMNLIMTAVVSEYVGSRFIIQKKSPFHPLWKS